MRVRFAPSPTGFLHIGGLRTALYNYLLARREGGVFVLRIEDTDRTRFVADAEADIISSLEWAGITFDEGPGVGGPHEPYYQSHRSDRYREVADQLVFSGAAYIAFDTDEEITAMREAHRSKDNPTPGYNHATRGSMTNSLTLGESDVADRIARGDAHVVRLKVVPGSTVSFKDVIRGDVSFESDGVDDQVLLKSDGLPTYHLANIVDDHDMGITHVIRGEEWLPSTPKHVLLYEAMGWDVPSMSHLPLILSPTGGKLSKRNAEKQGIPVSVAQYIEAGYEPEALINFLALLGWNPGTEDELFNLEQLTAAFSLERVGQSGVQFDLAKLKWFNEQWLRSKPDGDIAASVQSEVSERFAGVTSESLVEAVGLMKERLSFAHDILDASYLFEKPASYDEKAVSKRWKADSSDILRQFADKLSGVTDWEAGELESTLKGHAEQNEIGLGKLMFPLRMVLSGQGGGPDLYAMMAFLGKEETLERVREGADTLQV